MQINSIQNLFRSNLLINKTAGRVNSGNYNNLQDMKNDSFELRATFKGKNPAYRMTETDKQEKALAELEEMVEAIMLSSDQQERKVAFEIYDLIMQDTNATNIDGKNALMLSMELKNGEISDLCLQAGCRASDCDNNGRNALHHAICNKKHNTAKLMLDKYTSLSLLQQVDDNGNTPLHYALMCDCNNIAEKILREMKYRDASAGCNTANNDGVTPCDIARQKGDGCLARYISVLTNR